MNQSPDLEELTFKSLFMLSPGNTGELTGGMNGDLFKAITSEASSLAEPVPLNQVQSGIAGAIMDSLQTNVIGGWASAWLKCKEVREKAEESCTTPDEIPCTLAEHSVESTLHPYVDVLVGAKLIQRIDVDVTVETQILGLILMLKGGSMTSLQVGRCQWTGTIVAQGVELIRRDLAQLQLPGRVELRAPIRIVQEKRALAR